MGVGYQSVEEGIEGETEEHVRNVHACARGVKPKGF
jgi:hypothetical protein